MIYALFSSDENTVMHSTSAPWKLQLEHTGAALLRSTVHLACLSTGCPFIRAVSGTVLRSQEVEVVASFACRRGSNSTFTMTNHEVALIRKSLNLVDCHGMLRAWLEQHCPWGSRTVIKAVMGWGNSVRFL